MCVCVCVYTYIYIYIYIARLEGLVRAGVGPHLLDLLPGGHRQTDLDRSVV